MEKTRKIKFLILFAFTSAFFIALPAAVQAASLYFSPSSGSYIVGSMFSVNVYVSSADQAMNAASGVISFPQDKLEITSFSKSGSIFTLWVQEPSFSNALGTVNFEGIVLNPGFTGSSGKIISANFKVKAAGSATLNFSSGSVFANDGQGTNILASLGNASFSLGGAEPSVPEATTPSEAVGTPSAPQISSPTHPDPNKWYAASDAKFTWSLPSGVTAARLLVGKIPQA
ncbi:MAG: cohesin domain-containing protein, partial [Patescibacteria group bacterium]|nr:cohesin domain-containing protein [Patescibacteria group bacterium]